MITGDRQNLKSAKEINMRLPLDFEARRKQPPFEDFLNNCHRYKHQLNWRLTLLPSVSLE